jgi:hypothetical protein
MHEPSPQKQSLDSISLPVEVSGWDAEERFFVEHSTLACSQLGEKTLFLRNAVQAGSIVFLRALYGDGFAKSYPEPHCIQGMEPPNCLGYKTLHLTDFPPRRHGSCEPKDSLEHLIGVHEEVKQ